jgi:hypothetical protein
MNRREGPQGLAITVEPSTFELRLSQIFDRLLVTVMLIPSY